MRRQIPREDAAKRRFARTRGSAQRHALGGFDGKRPIAIQAPAARIAKRDVPRLKAHLVPSRPESRSFALPRSHGAVKPCCGIACHRAREKGCTNKSGSSKLDDAVSSRSSVAEDRHAVGDRQRQIDIVRDEHDASPAVGKRAQITERMDGKLEIEARVGSSARSDGARP